MRFSLIMGTLDRTKEISRFLTKLESQTFQDFELIVVDQNPDDRLIEILKPFQNKFSIIHLHSIKGLSRARNIGIKASRGEIIAFPDDDCWYPENLLEKADRYLKDNLTWDGLSGSTAEDNYWDKNSGFVTQFKVWKQVIEYCIFLRRDLVLKVGELDEDLGVGSGTPYWAGEITDYLLRALKLGCCLYYETTLEVHHPGPMEVNPSSVFSVAKSYHYAMGKGRVLRKSNSPLLFVAYQCSKPLLNLIICLIKQNPEKAQLSWAVFKGIVQGWRGVA